MDFRKVNMQILNKIAHRNVIMILATAVAS